jgi:hypothetical protein
MPIAPVMIYGDDVTHIVTEDGSGPQSSQST